MPLTETASKDPNTGGSFRLDELQVDPATGRIAGPGGIEQVDPKVMQVLVALAGSPGALVSRAELLNAIWPGGDIYDDTLTQAVYQLRRHLVAAGGSNRYRKLIKTLPKRGYLLECEVLPPTAAKAQHRPRGTRWTLWLLALVLIAGGLWWLLQGRGSGTTDGEVATPAWPPDAIAVLPFINSSGDAANDYLSDGVADNLRDRIAALHELRVVARRSSAQFRDSLQGVQEVGRQLGVGHIIEGRFNRVRDRVTVSIELVEAASGFQLWSEVYEGSADELMLLEQALSRDLVDHLLPGRALDPLPAPSVRQLAAHDLILLGRQYEHQVADEQRVDQAKLDKAIDFYSRAIAVDPDSAEAHARLGRVLLYQGSVVEAEPHILKALELDPHRGETFTTLGLYYWAVRADGIGEAFRRAIELNPNDADALSGFASWRWMQGAADDAVIFYRRALEVDPLSLQRYADLAYKLAFAGLRDEAGTVLERMLRLFPTAPGYLAAARSAEALGDLDEAIAWALRAQHLRPDDPEAGGLLAELFARLGDFEAATRFEPEPGMGLLFWQRRYEELIELGEEATIDRPGDSEARLLLAFAYSALGHQQQALRQMELAGMPKTVLSESRRAYEVHALANYFSALSAGGREEEARALAKWNLDWNETGLSRTEGLSWASPLTEACALLVLDEVEAALDLLETLPERSGIPRLPWLLDLACFDRLQEEPRYQAVVAGVESRIAALQQRLPDTLARHGLNGDPRPQ